ncbi:MAG: hypothetical protein A2096_09685 [Spirochaetes bacterium GWF1_41_5]|nr:MAG: hypothetical protein A2096_09685 [Spirochaetes bacterium GWF1_41_5]HBE03252.1 aminoacyl-tRNA hydrolase [Spirochaetia bacterium]
MVSKLILGFGNPGDQYKNNRRNLGFHAIDYLSEALQIKYNYEKKKAIFGKKTENKIQVILLKPQTFCNLSGEAVLYLAAFLKVQAKNILAIYDEPVLPPGQIEIFTENQRFQNGHSGLKSLSDSLKSDEYKKLAVGIGGIEQASSLEEYLLADFSSKEFKIVKNAFPKMCELVKNFISDI